MQSPDVRFARFAGIRSVWLIAGLVLLTPTLQSAPKKWKVHGDLDQDFPFQIACVGNNFPTGNVAYKGVTIKLGNDAYMCFDTDLLRMASGWTGNYLNFDGVTYSGSHGNHPTIAGDQRFGTKVIPGVADQSATFKDKRPEPFGPISEDLGRWNGMYVNGDDVVLSYTVRGTKILETPASVQAEGQVGFVRNIKIEKAKEAFALMVCGVDSARFEISPNHVALKGSGTNDLTIVELVGAPKGANLQIVDGNQVIIKIDKKTSASTFKVVIWNGPQAEQAKFSAVVKGKAQIADIKQAGPARWTETVTTKGVISANSTPDGAYTVDQLTPPMENPWKRRVRFAGFDFFADGKRAAVSTWDGDIWVVSGIDDKLENLTWKRFASGQYETLGLRIVDDVIYTSGRDQITRYHDLNGDGEADYYENFNNQITSSSGFHEFVFDLQTDSQGNFYMCKAGPVRGGGRGFGGDNFGSISAHAGTMLKISKDGKKLEVYATGFRAPNGMGVGPKNEITTSDNEGTWMPTTPINLVRQGGFYGVETLAHKNPIPAFDKPICWLSHNDFDNSGGGQVWVNNDKWGPLNGELLHMSYGKCALYLVMKETVNGQNQGGVVKIPVKFTSSAMRGRFNSKDGQLYVSGLQGWQTSAVKLAGFDRVRYTGKAVQSVRSLHVTKTGVELCFTQPLDAVSANDSENYSGKRWNYERAEHYGSEEFSVTDPKKKGRDDLEIKSAKLQADGKTVVLEITDFKPAMQEMISFDIKAKDGTAISQSIQHTIHTLP